MTQRLSPTAARPWADSNIRPRFPIEAAAWIGWPGEEQPPGLRFRCRFTLPTARRLVIQVSADQRFELACDGQRIGIGPDRGDPAHWAFHAYALELAAGEHQLDATVWSFGNVAPLAAYARVPAFILGSEDPADAELVATGHAVWDVAAVTGLEIVPPPGAVFGVGCCFVIDHAAWASAPAWRAPVTVLAPFVEEHHWGIRREGWRLEPSPLPEQIWSPLAGGRVRVVDDGSAERLSEADAETAAPWQAWLTEEQALILPAGTSARVIIDLETYACVFPELVVDGGAGAELELEWAESAFVESDGKPVHHHSPKGDRSALAGKGWCGVGDRFRCDGSANQRFTLPWWRPGRYLQLRLRSAGEPLTLRALRLHESRYPLEDEGAFSCDDPGLEPVRRLSLRGLQMCSHETYMDCPYYEQLMYVGDTRVQMLVHFCLQRDSRLQARAIDLFDWSRAETGFIAERYPCREFQLSLTFSLIWPLMVHDFARWRDDAAACRRWLVSVRALLDQFTQLPDDDGLLTALPGWSFMDWVPGWDTGYPPSGHSGTSAIINLHHLLALEAAAELEDWFGEAQLAQLQRQRASALAARIQARFWDAERRLFADDDSREAWSQHAQCLAVLSSGIDQPTREACFAAMLAADDLAECTVYYSHYRFEAYRRMGRGDQLYRELDFWKALDAQGFTTPVESPEPSRSDCHAWGAHPLYHSVASLIGLRPAAPGFARFELTPSPGPLRELRATLPHPQGVIEVDLQRDDDGWKLVVDSPVPGVVRFEQLELAIASGHSQHHLALAAGSGG